MILQDLSSLNAISFSSSLNLYKVQTSTLRAEKRCIRNTMEQPPIDLCQDSMTLAKHLMTSEEQNLVFSPFSINVILGLIASGLKGEPQKELLDCLYYESSRELNDELSDQLEEIFGSSFGGPCLAFANGLWIDQSRNLKKAFKILVKKYYQGAIKRVDFQTQVSVHIYVLLLFLWYIIALFFLR